MTGGNFNVVVGDQAFAGSVGAVLGNKGCFNVAIGEGAMGNHVSGDNNIAIGYSAGWGYCSVSGLNNYIVMGNAGHVCALINIPWTPTSDERKKKIKGPVPLGLDFVTALEPIEFQFMNQETQEVTDETYRYGFSAQKVISLEVDPENPVIGGGSDEGGYSMTNDYLVPTLVNAIQEMASQIEDLKTEIATLKGKN
jgi:hypothetical protein